MRDTKNTFKQPAIIGHRGCAAYAPENTLEGIHTAADMGVEWVELDVKLTRDHVPILFHDDTLGRTTNGNGPVADATYEHIRALEAGSWFGDSFAGTKIPTLEEAIETLIDRDLGFHMEIKPCPGREKETAEIALDILSQYWDDMDRLIVSSFSHVSLETALDIAPEMKRGLALPAEWPENWQEIAAYLDISSVHINGNTTHELQIRKLRALRKPILAYTINDPDRAELLKSWGVSGFFTDAPDVLAEGR